MDILYIWGVFYEFNVSMCYLFHCCVYAITIFCSILIVLGVMWLYSAHSFLPSLPVISGLWPWFLMIWEWFLMFLWSHHRKNHCRRNRVDHVRLCGTEFTLLILCSTEITRYRSWFLEQKLSQVNFVPHGPPWWILYIQHMAVKELNVMIRHDGISMPSPYSSYLSINVIR